MIRRRIVLYGWVQGVGLRYRARHAAASAGVTGWVRNESDGSVTMELQGTAEQIDRVVALIERGTFIRVERREVSLVPVQEDERSFETDG